LNGFQVRSAAPNGDTRNAATSASLQGHAQDRENHVHQPVHA
jgi:hypothetical protein